MHLAPYYKLLPTRLFSLTSPHSKRTPRLIVLLALLCWGVSPARAAGCSTPTFNVAPTYAVGQQPIAVATGDFNADGITDLVTANTASGNVSILKGDAQGAFGIAANFGAGANPYYVAVGDFNGDDKDDVAAVNINSNTISVLLGNGMGGLGAPAAFPVGSSPRAVVARDFNGDNKTDLVATNFFNNSVSLLLGNGSGSFAPTQNFSTGATGGVGGITTEDFNGDGKPDVVVTKSDPASVSVLLNNGAGGFAPAISSNATLSGLAIASADFNGDGNLDLAVADTSGSVATLLGNGAGGFVMRETFNITSRMQDVKIGDINGDGKADIFTANYVAGNVAVMLGNGQGGFAPPKYFGSGGSYPWAIAPGDYNRDGKLDLAVVNNTSNDLSVMLNDGRGGLDSTLVLAVNSTTSPRSLAVADLNRDGRVDIITESDIFLADGNGGFIRGARLPAESVQIDVATADFNGDGKFDIVTTGHNNTVSIFLGDGAGVSRPMSYAAGFEPRDVFIADLNRDARPDLVVTNNSSGTVTILLGNGTGGFAPAQTYAAGPAPADVAAADMNGDGRTDLVVANTNLIANTGLGNISVLLGDGTGAFRAPLIFDTERRPISIAIADFNGDGKADAATANANGGASVLLGNGNGGLSPPAHLTTGFNPTEATTGDMNGDGRSDLVVAHFNSPDISLLLGDGLGGFARAVNIRSGGPSLFVVATDLNGDGKPDLAVANNGESRNVGVLFNACNTPSVPLPSLSMSNQSVTEGSASTAVANFTVSLSAASERVVTANYYTSDQSATAALPGADYQFASGRLTFAPGVTSQVVSVAINGDSLDEFDETFKLNLGDVLNAVSDESRNVITIIDDDPLPALSIGDAAVTESDSGTVNASFTVSLSAPSAKSINVSYVTVNDSATAVSDYQPAGGTLNFSPGETSKVVNVQVNGDMMDEFDETFRLVLSAAINATIGDAEGIGTINDNDLPPSASINSITLREGNAGTSTANFTVSLSAQSSKLITLSYATADGSASVGTDYQASVGTMTFTPGQTSNTITILVNGDTITEPDETFLIILSAPSNVTIASARGTATILNDDGFRFSQVNYQFGEGDARATLIITRTGDASSAIAVSYRTIDTDTFAFGCGDTGNNQGGAYARCDFATAVGIVNFAAGDAQPKIITIPLIDDAYVEGVETFQVQLSNAQSATLDTFDAATITIQDNDSAGAPNPIMTSNQFFVRQQYLDFLSREPDASGFNAWLGVLNNCSNIFTGPNVPSGCDRIFVSGEGFFRSQEFQLKGFYVFRFYKLAFNRLPEYPEIVSDMSFVAGQTADEVFARKAQLPTLLTQRAEFQTLYGGMTNAQYVASLLGRYGLTQITTLDPGQPDGPAKVTMTSTDLTNRLDAGTLTRAQVLRAVADSEESGAREFDNAFVAMQYYGYLRRKPEAAGYEAWLGVLRRGDIRTMVDGFMNSAEYKLRFGGL